MRRIGFRHATIADQTSIKRHIEVVDDDTDEPIDNVLCWAWGDAEALYKPGGEPLFTEQHFESPDQQVMILAVPCDGLQRITRRVRGAG